jgi:hypothetical protein
MRLKNSTKGEVTLDRSNVTCHNMRQRIARVKKALTLLLIRFESPTSPMQKNAMAENIDKSSIDTSTGNYYLNANAYYTSNQ